MLSAAAEGDGGQGLDVGHGVAQPHRPKQDLRLPLEEAESQDLQKTKQRKKDQRDAEDAGAAHNLHHGNAARGVRNRRANEQAIKWQRPGEIHQVTGASGKPVKTQIDQAGDGHRVGSKAIESGDEAAYHGDQGDGAPFLIPTGNDRLHRFQQYFEQSGIPIGLPENLPGVENQEARPHGEIAPQGSLEASQRRHMVIAERDY